MAIKTIEKYKAKEPTFRVETDNREYQVVFPRKGDDIKIYLTGGRKYFKRPFVNVIAALIKDAEQSLDEQEAKAKKNNKRMIPAQPPDEEKKSE